MLEINTWIQTDEHQFLNFDGSDWTVINENKFPDGKRYRTTTTWDNTELEQDFNSGELNFLLSTYTSLTPEAYRSENPENWQQFVAEMLSEQEWDGMFELIEHYSTLEEIQRTEQKNDK